MEFHVLGPVTVTSGSDPLKIGGPKQRTVMAMLIACAGRPVTADALATAVYGDEVPERSRRLIQTYVSTLRSVVGDLITKNGDGWSLTADRSAVDSARVEDLYESAAHLDRAEAAELLREALSVWRGAPYADIEAHGELDAEIIRLEALRLTMLEARLDADLDLGRHGDVVGELDGLVAEHPYRERFRAQHMLALYRSGRQRDALDSYRQMRELLVDELGVDPSPELQGLERRILDQDDSLNVDVERRAVRPAASDLSNLPVTPTPIVGRVAEIERVRGLLADHRIVTLTGVGGCGKTRLAIEVAHRMSATFRDGVHFVDLSAISNDEGVESAVADAVLLGAGGGRPLERVAESLDGRQVLVVLDNCEHVVQGCIDVTSTLLERPGECRLLATSRESLGVDGEQLFGVPPMSSGGDAAELFEVRARELDPDFGVGEANRPVVQELCERLDGMPLAIELAAARITVMSPHELLAQIDDRFRLLGGGRRRSGDRRRTLEATLDWSYGLLTDDERQLFDCLGVFIGPFDAPDAAAVAQLDDLAAIDLLEALVAKSMVRSERGDRTTQFRLLATVRAYAEGQLLRSGDLEPARDRHLAHMLERAPDIDYWDWITAMPNIDAAIDWAIACERWTDAAALTVDGPTRWHELPIGPAALDRLELIAERLPDGDPLEDRLRAADFVLAIGAGLDTRAIGRAREALRSENPKTRDTARILIGNVMAMMDPDESLRMADAIEGSDAETDTMRESIYAYVHMCRQEYPQALDLLEQHADFNVLFAIATAALHLLNGQPAQALALSDDRPIEVWNVGAFEVIAGLSELALDRRDCAEQRILDGARVAADGRIRLAANASLIGIAALADDDGEVDWATEIMLGAPKQRFAGLMAVARFVADRLGVGEEYVRRQTTALLDDDLGDATHFLRETLARWDART